MDRLIKQGGMHATALNNYPNKICIIVLCKFIIPGEMNVFIKLYTSGERHTSEKRLYSSLGVAEGFT